MPLYEFQCRKCNVKFEDIAAFDETDKYPTVVCPECGSKKKEKLISACHVVFAQPEGTDKWHNTSTGHDYRFKHNIPKVKQEREMAEALSHMGTDPYGGAGMLESDIEMDTGTHDAESRKGLS